MKTSTLLLGCFALPLLACGGDLNVGGGPPDSSSTSVVGSGSCKASDCSAYAIQCSSGTPTNLTCSYDSNNDTCSLSGQCSDPSATQTCSFTPSSTCSGNGPCAEVSGVPSGGSIVLSSDPATSVTTLSVDFSSTTSQTIGACEYQSTTGGYSYAEGQPIPNEGTVTATSANFALSDSPACDGVYTPATVGQLVDQGSVIAFAWGGVANGTNPTLPSIPAPHGISLSAGVSDGTTIARSTDTTLTWTPLETPLSLEQVAFDRCKTESTFHVASRRPRKPASYPPMRCSSSLRAMRSFGSTRSTPRRRRTTRRRSTSSAKQQAER